MVHLLTVCCFTALLIVARLQPSTFESGSGAAAQPVYGVIARLINGGLYTSLPFSPAIPAAAVPGAVHSLAGDGGQHIQQHIVYGRKHSAVKIIVTRCEPVVGTLTATTRISFCRIIFFSVFQSSLRVKACPHPLPARYRFADNLSGAGTTQGVQA
ncbi:hypothetical protein BANRA_05084 [Escherichia coli]|nr:hypothetical protein BANRA_05084 [Escherichia coli]